MTIPKNYHLIDVKYLGPTDYNGSRVRLRSDRFQQRVIFSYTYDYNSARDQAIAWLEEHGFNVVGQAETRDGYALLTDTFKPLRGIK